LGFVDTVAVGLLPYDLGDQVVQVVEVHLGVEAHTVQVWETVDEMLTHSSHNASLDYFLFDHYTDSL
jgi:hypothetical protein